MHIKKYRIEFDTFKDGFFEVWSKRNILIKLDLRIVNVLMIRVKGIL